jgi:hypothetical protein
MLLVEQTFFLLFAHTALAFIICLSFRSARRHIKNEYRRAMSEFLNFAVEV